MRKSIIVCLVLLLMFAVACTKKEEVAGEEEMEPKIQATEVDDGLGLPQVSPSDKLSIELTIYHPRHIYLSGTSPVTVFTPAMPGFEFTFKKINMTTPSFPMIITCDINRKAPKGKNVIKLGIRVTYTEKANETSSEKIALLEVPIQVVYHTAKRIPKIVKIPLEHYLELDSGIEIKEPK